MHNSLTALLTQVRDGSISVADAALQLREAPFEDLGYARVDHHRRLRQGAAEVIYGAGKTPEQIAGIVDSLQRSGQKTVLITRMKPEVQIPSFHNGNGFWQKTDNNVPPHE